LNFFLPENDFRINVIEANEKTRSKWLDRLWESCNDDGVGFLDVLGERWGDVCGSAQIASQWADEMVPIVQGTWEETKQGVFSYFHGTAVCLSCLLVAERYAGQRQKIATKDSPVLVPSVSYFFL
jgi:hypothetical protein